MKPELLDDIQQDSSTEVDTSFAPSNSLHTRTEHEDPLADLPPHPSHPSVAQLPQSLFHTHTSTSNLPSPPSPHPTECPPDPELASPVLSSPEPDEPKPGAPWYSTQHYGRETVLVLLECTKKAGYGDQTVQKKPLKEIFAAAVKLAELEHGIKRTAKGWNKKFTRMRVQYKDFIERIGRVGKNPDDSDLHSQPYFFREMHEMEMQRTNHTPPALLCTAAETEEPGEDDNSSSSSQGSLRKKAKLGDASFEDAQMAFLKDYAAKQERRTAAFVEELQRANEGRANLCNAIERLAEKWQ